MGKRVLSQINECLKSGWISSQGPMVDRFEATLRRYLGARYAVAVVNGTAALHVSLSVAGIGPGGWAFHRP